ncbi:hypothetical protein JCM18382A_51710 [Bradyrhizobium sp. 17-4]
MIRLIAGCSACSAREPAAAEKAAMISVLRFIMVSSPERMRGIIVRRAGAGIQQAVIEGLSAAAG